jgi:Glycosyl hydrolase catalytic core
VKVSSPAIVFNVGWLETFMKVLKFFGREPDFIQLHYYGGWQTADLFKEFVSGIHKKVSSVFWVALS